MTRKPKIGLLPLYIALYVKTNPEALDGFTPMMEQIVRMLDAGGIDTVQAPVCTVEKEFQNAVATFEENDIDLIVTLHLAYSPSLESVDVLAQSKLPILMLDVTMDYRFGKDVDSGRIMYNHGIHGVQDLASMLRRRGKEFQIVAGHVEESGAVDRAVKIAKAAYAARCFNTTKALRIGNSFKGMGDFSVDETVLKNTLGIDVDEIAPADLSADAQQITEQQIAEEIARDKERFECQAPEDVHKRSVRVGLAVRRRLEECGYTAFSMNFLAFDSPDEPINTVPFLEASKAMSRRIGYAGEGDVLTASLVGALCRGFGETTFTECFCPDWEGDSIFLSHMGEFNPDTAASKPVLIEKPFPYTAALNPAVAVASPRQGPAVLVNLVPGPNDTFSLIVAPVVVIEDTTNENMKKSMRGWIQPMGNIGEFLENYSLLGGTHHSALVLGENIEAIVAFADFLAIESNVI